MHLLSWDVLSSPKSAGFRMTCDLNNAFLMKLGQSLINDKEALWVKCYETNMVVLMTLS